MTSRAPAALAALAACDALLDERDAGGGVDQVYEAISAPRFYDFRLRGEAGAAGARAEGGARAAPAPARAEGCGCPPRTLWHDSTR